MVRQTTKARGDEDLSVGAPPTVRAVVDAVEACIGAVGGAAGASPGLAVPPLTKDTPMTDTPPARTAVRRLIRLLPALVLAGVLAWVLVTLGPSALSRGAPGLGAPDWALLAGQSPAILIHLTGAVIALLIGGVQLAGIKGTTAHRVLGWTWVVAMTVTAVSSLFIRQINGGAFSFIHILSGLTLVALPMAVHAARRHRVKDHRGHMVGLFVGALIVAGSLAFLPGRLMWAVFFA